MGGSSYYNTHHNFFVYGGNGMKNDFGGHDNHHHDNVYGYVGQAIGFYDAPMLAGHADVFVNNRVVMTSDHVGSGFSCGSVGSPNVTSNHFFTGTGNVSICNKPLNDVDPASTVAKLPSDETIFGWAKDLLGF